MKKLKLSLVFAALTASFTTLADSVAITNTTVYTGTEQGVLTGANVVIEDGKVVSINPAELNVDSTVDGQGRILTAGFISSLNQLGLVEVDAVSASRDMSAKKGGISFEPFLAFNPNSTLIPFSRKGGITHSVIAPRGSEGIWAGQVFTASLSGEYDSVVDTNTATLAYFGSERRGSRASSLATFEKELQDQLDKLKKAKEKSKDDDKKDSKAPSKEEQILTSLLDGSKPLIADVERATDILHLLKLKERFGLNLVLSGAKDAVRVKDQIAEAGVPVIMESLSNLPGSFDSLNASLENAAELERAGVKLILTQPDTHLSYNLRTDAGVAIANGLSREGALNAVTKNVADVFGLPGGVVAEGQPANLVLWSGDPFEISTKVENIWIDGEQVTTESRQDKLRDRYTSKEKKPRGYIK
ncbi:amidohydrolase family protein [Psychrosphaera aestuarii]|uniref:amidohydrolase family protein n=1 Tax=Psychrosphaera aestuarii TaxID=1266052 RepID=UPI001B31971B|nr:amidohydrolase family protein [Psychrosphaera aestuarii]